MVGPMSSGEPNSPEIDRPKRRRGGRVVAWIGESVAHALIALVVAAAVGVVLLNLNDMGESTGKKRSRVADPTGTARDDWPDGATDWTVVLASAPTPGQADAAVDQAKRVPTAGLNVGVLHSNDYARLEPGYWVAFAGQFDTEEEAKDMADRYRAQFHTAYQQFIEER